MDADPSISVNFAEWASSMGGRQLTLVALYDRNSKPTVLLNVLNECRRLVRDVPGIRFEYEFDDDHVHATVIGLEHWTAPNDVPLRPENLNFRLLRGEHREMFVSEYLGKVRDELQAGMTIRFGGFTQGDESFRSRGKSPYERSFSIQGSNVVLVGWPTDVRVEKSLAAPVPNARARSNCNQPLAHLRRLGEHYGILHTYHIEPDDCDNDLYMRLGTLDTASLHSIAAHRQVERRLRDYLSTIEPVRIELTDNNVFVVAHDGVDRALSPATTKWLSLSRIHT